MLNERDSSQILINEVMVNRMGFSEPGEAIGKEIKRGDIELLVKGVVKNFHVNSLHQSIDPTILLIDPTFYFQANIKIMNNTNYPENQAVVLNYLSRTWEKLYPNDVLQYDFLDQQLKEAYINERTSSNIARISTFIILVISSLGLFSVSSIFLVQREKEMAIRKVLGAGSFNIFSILTGNYLRIGLVAYVISVPLVWWSMNRWLENFSFRIDITWWIFVFAGSVVLLIILITTSYHSLKATIMNPVEFLRE